MKKPKLEDFYDSSDPRGCSTREHDEWVIALNKWEKLNKKVQNGKPK